MPMPKRSHQTAGAGAFGRFAGSAEGGRSLRGGAGTAGFVAGLFVSGGRLLGAASGRLLGAGAFPGRGTDTQPP